MRKTIRSAVIGLAAVAACLGFTARAEAVALTQASPSYMGLINPDVPAGQALEESYVNKLSEMAPPSSTTFSGQALTRSANTLCYNTCPDPDFSGKRDNGNPNFTFVTPFTGYILAKYDADQGGALVWYVVNLTGAIDVPQNFGTCGQSGCGLSHTSFFGGIPTDVTPEENPGDVVPEPASLLLLGTGLSAAAFRARRRAMQKA